jgi:hypothetical protein
MKPGASVYTFLSLSGIQCHVIQCVLNPRFLNYMASYDVASNIWRALSQAVHGGERRGGVQYVPYPRAPHSGPCTYITSGMRFVKSEKRTKRLKLR